MFNIFQKTTPIDDLLKLGKNNVTVSNGISVYSRNIFNKEAYVNQYLIIGIGKYYSASGDWGYGYDYASTNQILLYVDKNLNIQRIEICEPFYNASTYKEDTKLYHKITKLEKKIKLNSAFNCNNKIVMKWIQELLKVLPTNVPINQDNILKYPHMLNYFLNESLKRR